MNKSLKSFYDVYNFPEIKKFLKIGKKKTLEVCNILIIINITFIDPKRKRRKSQFTKEFRN
jgi:hypothetical protein